MNITSVIANLSAREFEPNQTQMAHPFYLSGFGPTRAGVGANLSGSDQFGERFLHLGHGRHLRQLRRLWRSEL